MTIPGTIPGPGLAERALMERTLALCEEVARFLERTRGTTEAEIDLVGVGLLTRAAHRGLTPEARMCELQALVRRWVHDDGGPAPPVRSSPSNDGPEPEPRARIEAQAASG